MHPLRCVYTWPNADGSTSRCSELAVGTHRESSESATSFLLPLCEAHGWAMLVGRLVKRREAER